MSKLISEHRYLCILLVGMLTAYNAIAQLDSAATSRFGLGYKEMHYGIPFLYLEGTDYQMGLEYGHLLKNELTTVYTEFENLKKEMMDREIKHLPWYEKLPANLFGGLIFKHKINEFADRLPVDI